MSRILLAGATGYARGHILRELLDRDLEVRVLVRSPEELPDRVKGHSKLEIQQGRIYLFGMGRYRMNPIHGADLARVCADAIDGEESEIELGGPEVLTHEQIAEQAFEALGKEPRITHIPDFIRRNILLLAKTFSGVRTYGPIEFFLTMMAMDMTATIYGKNAWPIALMLGRRKKKSAPL